MKHFTELMKYGINGGTFALDTSTWDDLFQDVGDFITNLGKSAVNKIVVPVGLIFLLIILIIQIITLVRLHRDGRGSEISEKIPALVITIVVMALIGVYATWAWSLI